MLNEKQRKLVSEVCRRVPGNERNILYHVSFDHPTKGKVFGIVDTFDDDAYAQANEGRLIVIDLVYPSSRGPYAVKAEKLTPHEMDWNSRPKKGSLPEKLGFFQWGGCPQDDYCALEGLAHQIRADANGDHKGVAVDDMFRIGVADGFALYVVTRVAGRRCDVEWRGFWNADRYTDHYFGWGRNNVNVSDVKRYVGFRRGMDKLLSKKRESIDKPKAFETLMKEYEKNHGFPAPVVL